jgi:osmotically-inducible protein OsmY
VTESQAPEYSVARIREALAGDPRVGEIEIDVRLRGARVILSGALPTEERRRTAAEVAREAAGGLEVVDQLEVTERSPGPEEQV